PHSPRVPYTTLFRSWSGDTRPIPEVLAKHADAGELVAHDCALHGNPSHSGSEDLEREYPAELLDRCILYHYAGVADGQALAGRGYRVATPGEVVVLADPAAGQRLPARTPCSTHPRFRSIASAVHCATCACR